MPAPPRTSASSSSGATVRRSSRQRPLSTRPTTGGCARAQRRGVGLGQAHRGAGQLDAGRAASADGRDAVHRLRPSRQLRRRAVRPARASSVDVGVERPGHRRRRSDQRRLQRGERELVDAQRPAPRDAVAAARSARPSPNSRPACGPPSSLSPLAVTRSAPSRSTVVASGSSGSSGCGVSRPEPMSTTSGDVERGQLGDRDRRGEAGDVVVRRVDLEHEAGVGPDRVGVVARACVRLVVPTSRMPRAGRRHQVGHAEAVADLDQLAAADHDLLAGGERHERRAAARRRCC